ncbi:hypothetical protein DV737_g3295, partial [Chaetothyriales sp. CBS 132003]
MSKQTVLTNAKLLEQELDEGSTCGFCRIIIDESGKFKSIEQGSDAEAAGAQEEGFVVDLQGKIISPAFVDGHMHILLFGSSLQQIDVEHCRSLGEIQETIRKGALEQSDGPRVMCRGWMQDATKGVALATDLDEVDELKRPIYITSKDLHSTWCNTAALKELDIQDTADPEGGTIHRDENGNPSGLLSEAAALSIVWPFLAKNRSFEENLSSVREAIKTYNAAGYTGMIEMATDDFIWELLQHLHAHEPENFTVRMACHKLVSPAAKVEDCIGQVDSAIAMHEKFNRTNSPDLHVAGVKLILDGVVDACTAALSQPYNQTTGTGEMLWQDEHISAVVAHADKAGLQCALHAIGDRAVRIAVDALEAHGTPGRRHRIEHLEVTRPEDALRLGKLGITASIQPVHSDPAILRAWHQLLGKERCGRAFAYSEFEAGGARLAIGTDAPTAPHEPFPNLHVATTRRSGRQNLGDVKGLGPVNEIAPLVTLKAFKAATLGAAESCFLDEVTGSVEEGKSADFVVVERSDEGEEGLMGWRVAETWFKGKKVWTRRGSRGSC